VGCIEVKDIQYELKGRRRQTGCFTVQDTGQMEMLVLKAASHRCFGGTLMHTIPHRLQS
jgi:hypothetical protein